MKTKDFLFKRLLLIAFTFSGTAYAVDEDFQFKAGDGTIIHGKISYPASGKSSPLVAIHAGSGRIDMDGTIPPEWTFHKSGEQPEAAKIYLQVSDALTEAGFATVRYNKRAFEKCPGIAVMESCETENSISLKDTIDDFVAAVQIALQHNRVDSSRLILLGHSEGTIIVPLAAKRLPKTSEVVLMSPIGSNERDTLRYFVVDRTLNFLRNYCDRNKDGKISDQDVKSYPELMFRPEAKLVDRDGDGLMTLDTEVRAYLEETYQGMVEENLKIRLAKDLFSLETPNAHELVGLGIPVTVLIGDADVQTPLSQAFLIEDNFKKAGKTDKFQLKIFKGLGHGFAPHMGLNEYQFTMGPFQPVALSYLKDWLRKKYL